MYQHLSEAAKAVVKRAENLARQDGQEYIGTEHVLKAIVDHGECTGARLLQGCSLTSDRIAEELASLARRAMEETWVFGKLPGTPHFKRVVALAIEEAEKLADSKVGTEYLLLGLLREKGCIAERALRHLGLTEDNLRSQISQMQTRPGPHAEA